MTGRLTGTGRVVILPVDQGFEHGPARSFAPNPEGYDPHYHYRLAVDAGLNAFAAPLGLLEAGADTFAGQIPTILKVYSSNSHATGQGPGDHRRGRGRTAPRLFRHRLHHLSGLGQPVRDDGGNPRDGGGGEIGRPRRRHLVLSARRRPFERRRDRDRHLRLRRPYGRPARRPHHQGQTADRAYRTGRGAQGPTKRRASTYRACPPASPMSCRAPSPAAGWSSSPAARPRATTRSWTKIRALRDGGASGSIIGRNSFQRPRDDALALLDKAVRIYKGQL